MNNRIFVESLKESSNASKYPSTIDDKVWEAMMAADRRDFVPDVVEEFVVIDRNLSRSAAQRYHEFDVLQKRLSEFDDPNTAPQELKEEYSEAMYNYIAVSVQAFKGGREWTTSINDLAYSDLVLHTDNEATSCSQPSLIAVMVDMLELQESMNVLEVGTGYGYHAAIVSHVIGEKGHLYTVEINEKLAKIAEENLVNHFGSKTHERLMVIPGDGSVGYQPGAPYDGIYLTAGITEKFDPNVLVQQLKPEKGILVFPEEEGNLYKQVYEKGKLVRDDKVEGVGFVPLVGRNS